MSDIVKDFIDVDKLLKDIFGDDKKRNDLAVGIYNNTNETLTIAYYVDHGAVKKVIPSTTDKIRTGETYKVGITAKGAGSNIGLSINVTSTCSFAVIAATPSNKQNYTKLSYRDSVYPSGKSAWNGANKHEKHYSENGFYEERHNGKLIGINITGDSPAACTITISE